MRKEKTNGRQKEKDEQQKVHGDFYPDYSGTACHSDCDYRCDAVLEYSYGRGLWRGADVRNIRRRYGKLGYRLLRIK